MREKDNKYGFFATFSIIFAGVVGVGIFFKGETVMNLTNSGLLTVISWLVISIIVLGLAYSYIEISSSTVKGKNAQQGTLYKWSSLFWNKKFGSFIGIFYCFFYMPLNLMALALISSRMLINLFVGEDYGIVDSIAGSNEWATSNGQAQFAYGVVIYLIAMLIIFFFISVNTFGTKFSKRFQSFGTILKIFLLAMVIGIIVFALASGINSEPVDPDDVPYDNTFVGDPKIGGFFLALPAVMFSLDGFVMSGTLQSDTKKRSTFSKALISAMSTIIILYLIVITGSALIRDAGVYDVPGIINRAFGDLPVFQLLLLLLITLSGISATNSWFIYLGRTVSDLAEYKEIPNKNGDLDYKHKQTGSFPYAYRLIMEVIMIYIISFFILDLWLFPYGNDVDVRNYFGNVEIAANDLIVMLMFAVYGIIVLGGIRNRRNGKVEVDKIKGFTPIAYFVVIALISVVVLYIISLPLNYAGVFSSTLKPNNNNYGSFWAIPIDIVLLLILVDVYLWLQKYLNKKGKNNPSSKANNAKNINNNYANNNEQKMEIKFKNYQQIFETKIKHQKQKFIAFYTY